MVYLRACVWYAYVRVCVWWENSFGFEARLHEQRFVAGKSRQLLADGDGNPYLTTLISQTVAAALMPSATVWWPVNSSFMTTVFVTVGERGDKKSVDMYPTLNINQRDYVTQWSQFGGLHSVWYINMTEWEGGAWESECHWSCFLILVHLNLINCFYFVRFLSQGRISVYNT